MMLGMPRNKFLKCQGKLSGPQISPRQPKGIKTVFGHQWSPPQFSSP